MRLALLSTLVVLCVCPATAGAATFGADLSATPDVTDTCGETGFGSCSFFTGAPGPGFYAPASGTVTAVRVKTGNFLQGQMQILVMTSLYQNKPGDPGHPYFACCFVQEYGPKFTPAANAITTVPSSLSMVEDPTPPPDDFSTNARGDFLALSVLAPNVPLPAIKDSGSGYNVFAPAPDPSTTPAPSPNPVSLGYSTDGFGAHAMMNADLNTGAGGGQGGGGGGGGTQEGAPLRIGRNGQLTGNTASIPLTCILTAACKGRLTLTAPAGRAAARRKPAVYGRSRYSIRAGKTGHVKVKLNAAGRKALHKKSKLTLRATTKIGSRTLTATVKLKRRRHG